MPDGNRDVVIGAPPPPPARTLSLPPKPSGNFACPALPAPLGDEMPVGFDGDAGRVHNAYRLPAKA